MLDARNPVALLLINANGDHLINLPAVRALSTLFAGRLMLICTRGTRERFFSDLPLRDAPEVEIRKLHEVSAEERPSFAKVYDAARRVLFSSAFDVGALTASIGDCDLLLSLDVVQLPVVEELLERLAPAESIGFSPSLRVPLEVDPDRHMADIAFDLPRRLRPSLRVEDFAAPPVFPPDSRRRARELRAALPAPFKVLAVHADTKPEKTWPAQRMTALLDAFLARHPEFLAVVVGTTDLGLDAGRHGGRVFPCYGVAINVAMSLVGEADLFVGVDSCMLHAADLFGVPGVGLFGPTSARQWGFRFAPHRHVCGGGGRMDAIEVGEVLEALEAVWAGAASGVGR